jgi:predicted AlkP superfamily phosphohydrolase/phosphomutase
MKGFLSRSGLSLAAAERLAHRLNVWKLLHYGIPRGKRAALSGKAFLSLGDIDWRQTRAVAVGYLGQIFMNVSGVRPLGTIDPANYPAERERLAASIARLRDPKTGEPVVERVFRREELYHGPHLDRAPDLVVHMKEGWSPQSGLGDGPSVFDDAPPNLSSDHAPESAFIAFGQGVAPAVIEARLEDVAPTILHALGVPIPAGCDGKPLPLIGTPTYGDARADPPPQRPPNE